MKRLSTRDLVLYALFVGLIFLLGLTPLGLIPLGFINVTVLCIPTVVGTMLLGRRAGLIFGFFFGLASLLSVLGLSMVPPSALAGRLLGVNVLYTVLMCFIPRLMVPVMTYAVYSLLNRRKKSGLHVAPAAIAGSLTNTVLYLGLMLLFYALTGLDNAKLLAVIGGTGLVAGGLEAAAAAIIATPVMLALEKLRK